jgi:hypothetical protein
MLTSPRRITDLYDMVRRELRPAYDRLANAHHIKRNPVTEEISWPPSLEDDLRKAGLL